MAAPLTQVAFFDVDETLIATKSMFDFLAFLGRSEPSINAEAVRAEMQRLNNAGKSRHEVNIAFWLAFAGLSESNVQQSAKEWVRERLTRREDFLIASSTSRLKQHKRDGHRIALVSGSSVDILAPVAAELKADYILATRLCVVNGHYTGAVLPPVMIGEGKRTAAQKLMDEIGAHPAACFAYGDHLSDLPLLELVGHPVVIGGVGELAELASRRGWQVLPGMEKLHQTGEGEFA